MERVVVGDIEMTWDPGTRVAVLRFHADTRATEPDARALVAAMEQWLGDGSLPFALLGDGARLVSVDAGYRAVWGEFLRARRSTAHLAFFHMGPLVRIAADMFRLGTGVRLKAFADETSARRWLRDEGIAA